MEESISAVVDEREAESIIFNHFGLQVEKISRLDGYFDVNFHFTCEKSSENMDYWPHGYVLKIINQRDSEDVAFFPKFFSVLQYLRSNSIPCQLPILNKKGEYCSYFKCQQKNGEASKHVVFVLTYLPGEILQNVQYRNEISFSLGSFLRNMHNKLQKFNDLPALFRKNICGIIDSSPDKIENMLHDVIQDEKKRSMLQQCCTEYREIFVQNMHKFEKGVVHGDLNLSNILVQKREPDNFEIVGVIDFADLQNTCYILDLAIIACYIALHDVPNCVDGIALFLAGYEMEPTDFELQVFKICICMRACHRLVVGTHTLLLHPDNDYIRKADAMKYGWVLLEKLCKMSHSTFAELILQKMAAIRREACEKINCL